MFAMKKIVWLLYCIALACILPIFAHGQEVSLGEMRAKLVNQRIYIKPPVVWDSKLQLFTAAKEKKGKYTLDYDKKVSPEEFVGAEATVVAVLTQPNSYNADLANEADDVTVAFAEMMMQLDNGRYLSRSITANDLRIIFDPEQEAQQMDYGLATMHELHRQKASELALQLQGKSIFLTRGAKVYGAGVKETEITALRVGMSRMKSIDAPLMTPLMVERVTFSPKFDYTALSLQFPDGREAIYYPGCLSDGKDQNGIMCAYKEKPSFLTAE